MDDYSRYIIAWLLTGTMATDDVKRTLEMAAAKSGLSGIKVRHRPRLLSDNGHCYLAGDLKQYLGQQGISHTRGQRRMCSAARPKKAPPMPIQFQVQQVR